ncbi:hypothetical protein GALMADRAFT_102508 [Galerina marginata CBS 339.88]|uniref:CxC5 like cysteine cluster associated with KDZ domain-containing protein n=1 Tax=Galerina marginata (strain CBS 339.88) TaxID=685588 RepID=A0A067SXQ6_GALM3|nr:hypothetical protein GALMADRAFT_102508 [Galerina marginata CBS 339.88]
MFAIHVLERLKAHPILRHLTLDGICTFARLGSNLKREILQPQPISESNPAIAPAILPEHVHTFLGKALGIPLEVMDDCWDILGDHVWEMPQMPLMVEDYRLFKVFGWPRGLTAISIYPQDDCCSNAQCSNQTPLKKELSRKKAVVYTQSAGAQPAWNVSLYCPKCNTSYHNNYAVNGGNHIYHAGIPDLIQVGDHQFVEATLAYSWRAHMLFGWFSASNASRVFKSTMAGSGFQPSDWGLSDTLTTNQVWDAFVILGLLEDVRFRAKYLTVPHTGDQSNRFKAAMEERNEWIILNGQPDAVRHACDLCMRIFVMPDGSLRKCQAIVGDGLNMGRPRCGIPHCRNPLQNNRHRFCGEHAGNHDICAIVGCNQKVVFFVMDPKGGMAKTKKMKTCSLPLHQEMEWKHHERSTGSFLYRQRLQHASVSQPVDSFSHAKNVPEQDIQEDFETYIVGKKDKVTLHVEKNLGSVGTDDFPPEPCPSKSESGNRTFKAHFGRQRTHNEQTLVRPCGIIFARATMFNAEAVSNFLVMVKNAFSVPGAQKPEHIFYDTNCLARQQAEKDPWFKGIGMCVDAWHFRNKHAVTHEYCQRNCNPAMYPELMDALMAWFFNTSIAEQTNAWLGGYHSMCREMLPAKYDFFLDEMIRLRNIEVLLHLQRQNRHPRIY